MASELLNDTPTISRMWPDPIGQRLGTGYQCFVSKYGINGLCKMPQPGIIWLLAVVADDPGKGSFREFIKALKREYKAIFIWQVQNEFLAQVLERYGFRPCEGAVMIQGSLERLEGYRWDL